MFPRNARVGYENGVGKGILDRLLTAADEGSLLCPCAMAVISKSDINHQCVLQHPTQWVDA